MLLLTMDTLGGIARFFTVLVLFLIVLWMTWAVTKWTAAYQKGKWANGNIEVLESFRIASDKYVQIVRVADKYLAVAVAKDAVTLLAELDGQALFIPEEKPGGMMSFQEVLEKVKCREILEKVREKKKE